jgi:hypothetical protein
MQQKAQVSRRHDKCLPGCCFIACPVENIVWPRSESLFPMNVDCGTLTASPLRAATARRRFSDHGRQALLGFPAATLCTVLPSCPISQRRNPRCST